LIWKIEYDPRALDDLERLDGAILREIIRYLDHRIAMAENPRNFGKPLREDKFRLWRYRVRDYRIICRLLDRFQRFRRSVWSRFFCRRGIASEGRARSWQPATRPFPRKKAAITRYRINRFHNLPSDIRSRRPTPEPQAAGAFHTPLWRSRYGPFTSLWHIFLQYCPSDRCCASLPVALPGRTWADDASLSC
jgi:mRNA interferase RelE/StbE